MTRVVAILETMWDWRQMTSGAGYQEAPRYFRINSENFSGRRLYSLIGSDAKLLVTNACRKLGQGPNDHGKGDPVWLGENLMILDGVGGTLPSGGIVPDSAWPPLDVVLICGRIAQQTFDRAGYQPKSARIIRMPHPAFRYWSKASLDAARDVIQKRPGHWTIRVTPKDFKCDEIVRVVQQPLRTLDGMVGEGAGA